MMAFTSVAFEFATVCFFFFCTTVVGLYKFVNVLASVGDRYNIFIGNLKSPNVCTLSNRLFNQPFYFEPGANVFGRFGGSGGLC